MRPSRLDPRALSFLAFTRVARCAAGAAIAVAACGCVAIRPGSSPAAAPGGALATRSTGNGRPDLAVVARQGDARGAMGVAATTEGIAPDRGAMVGVALAALVEARLAARGIAAVAVGGSAGWRLNALVETTADATAFVDALRAALLTPVSADDPAMAAVGRKASALVRLAPIDGARVDAARCTGEAYAGASTALPSGADLEAWRAAVHGLGRVAVAVAGEDAIVNAAANALAHGAAWPVAVPIGAAPWPASNARATVYDASGTLLPGSARVVVVAPTATPERAVAAAATLGGAHGALASRLSGLEATAHLTSVVATAHPRGGCLTATIELGARDLAADAPARIATAAALAREEVAVEIADATVPADMSRALTASAADPRDAAERAAWWSLAGARSDVARDAFATQVVVGVAAARDATDGGDARAEAIRAEIDRATLAWHAPIVDPRVRVERGQGEAWVVLGSPCGTLSEGAIDAGAGASVATAAAARAAERAGDARVEPFVGVDGIGVVVHGPAMPGETPLAQARRLSDAAARAFAADSLDEGDVARARSGLLADASTTDARALASLAGALAPGHPSWIVPTGTAFGHASASDESVALRAAAVRAGPMRVAVIANVDAAQADAAVRAVDRWIARRPGESRACPVAASLPPPRAGTYAVDRPGGAPSEALLGWALPGPDDATRTAATWLAAALAGDDGLLAHALGAGAERVPGRDEPLARAWDAAVLGAPHARVLAVRIVASDDTLDAAVAQARALFDRLRQGALRDEDLRRASAAIAAAHLAATLDPRERALAFWRGRDETADAPPSIDAVRALAAQSLRDEATVIVAARPPRVAPSTPRGPPPAHEPKAK
jgi:hypothetical protein